MRNKILTLLLLLFFVVFTSSVYASGEDKEQNNVSKEEEALNNNPIVTDMKINVNDDRLELLNNILVVDGNSYLPLEDIGRALGATDINYEANKAMIMVSTDDVNFFMIEGMDIFQINGDIRNINLAPFKYEDIIYIPLRLVSEAFGFEVLWDEETRTINLNKYGYKLPEDYLYNKYGKYTEDDYYWLCKMVAVEARNLKYDGHLAIANVILNRVNSPLFPNTVNEVIFQIDVYVQFPPAHKSWFMDFKVTETAKKACMDAIRGKNNVEDCLFFNMVPFRTKKDDFYKRIDGEYFYR